MEFKPKAPVDRSFKTSTLIKMALGFIIFWQCLMMILWVSIPWLDWVLLRFSLSNADAITIFALVLSFYGYWRFEKSSESEDMIFLQRFVLTLKENGVTPDIIRIVIKSQYGDKIKTIQKKLKEGKVKEEDLIEMLK
jgi:hypothetical protein